MLKGLPLSPWRVLSRHMRYLIALGMMILSSYLPSPAAAGTDFERMNRSMVSLACRNLENFELPESIEKIEILLALKNRQSGRQPYTLVDFFLEARCYSTGVFPDDKDYWGAPIHAFIGRSRRAYDLEMQDMPGALRSLRERMTELSGSEDAYYKAINRRDAYGNTAVDLIDKMRVPFDQKPDEWGFTENGWRQTGLYGALMRDMLCDEGAAWSLSKPSCKHDLPVANSRESMFQRACALVRLKNASSYDDLSFGDFERLFSGDLAEMRAFFRTQSCRAEYKARYDGGKTLTYTTTPMNFLVNDRRNWDVVLAILNNPQLFNDRQREKVLLRKDELGLDVRDFMDIILEMNGFGTNAQAFSLTLCLLGARCE